MKITWISLGAIAVAAGLAIAAYRVHSGSDTPLRQLAATPPPISHTPSTAPATAPAPVVSTATVRRGTLTAHVYASGIVQANRSENIKCQAGGQIINLPYQVGDSVNQGAVVLQVDSQSQEAAVQIAEQNLRQQELNYQNATLNLQINQQDLANSRQTDEASVLSDQAQVVNDRINLQRDDILLAEKLTSQQQDDNDHTTLTRDEQTLKQAQVSLAGLKTQELQVRIQKNNTRIYKVLIKSDQASLAQAKLNLAYTTVTAPISGVISAMAVQPGQVIASALTNVGGGTTVMSIVDLSHIFVLANIKERDINYVRIGDPVRITAIGAPGAVFSGRVVRVAPVAASNWYLYTGDSSFVSATSNPVTFEVKIEVLGQDKQQLKPGMTAVVDILTDQLRNVLYIPRRAVTAHNGHDTVMVVQPNQDARRRLVTLGQHNHSDCQVVSGLREGCKVLLP